MEYPVGYQRSLWCWPWVMWHRGMGLTVLVIGHRLWAALVYMLQALTPIFNWPGVHGWSVLQMFVFAWWNHSSELDDVLTGQSRPLWMPSLPSSKSPAPIGVCRAVTFWIYSQQTKICSSVLSVSWGNLWVPQMSLLSKDCSFWVM